MRTQLPIIDFTAQDAPQAFTASLHETGFAVLQNHPLAQSLIEGIYSEWAGFFQTEAKHSYARDAEHHDG
jgi:isopenicillin N synthase-like dioxygenase